MKINVNDIHVWTAELTIPLEKENEQLFLLSEDEQERAERFHFSIHRKRFIATRSALRQLLGMYLDIKPKNVQFAYDEHEKPSLQSFNSPMFQFNLSHSEDIAIYAFTLEHPIGIDIEKIQDTFTQGVAERFFSIEENQALKRLPPHEQVIGFYRIWSRKEAIIKAIGKGLAIPLSTFSVSIFDVNETITLENKKWSLFPIATRDGYQSALATTQMVKKIICWNWNFFDQKPSIYKEYTF